MNRPFPSSKKSHFQSEAKCEAIDMKMIFNYDANKIYFHNKGFALSLVLKVRFFGTRKWPIQLSAVSVKRSIVALILLPYKGKNDTLFKDGDPRKQYPIADRERRFPKHP